MDNELPLIVFITSAMCGHCIAFRGKDGRPDPSKPWNYDYIRMLLNKYPSKSNRNLKRRSSSIVEISVSTFQNNIDNIAEINIYTSIPSIAELNAIILEKGITSYRFFDENDIVGSSIERINIKRGTFNSIEITVDIDGKYSHYMTESNIDEYIWKQTPEEIQIIRTCIIEDIEVPKKLFESIENQHLREFVEIHYNEYRDDIKLFDQQLLTHYFNFPWLLSKMLVNDIRRYEIAYPCWMLVSPMEWKLSLEDHSRPIFARTTNRITVKSQSGYTTKPFTQGETIETLLDSYESGKIKLSYDPTTENVKLYSWQIR